jgi:hypothetical protein
MPGREWFYGVDHLHHVQIVVVFGGHVSLIDLVEEHNYRTIALFRLFGLLACQNARIWLFC